MHDAIFEYMEKSHAKHYDDDLRAFVREKLARFKAPRYFKWLGSGEEGVPDEWPQTDTGKISKPDLRKLVDSKS